MNTFPHIPNPLIYFTNEVTSSNSSTNNFDIYCQYQVVRLSVIYRPPPSTKNKTTHKQFQAEFADYLGNIVTAPGMLLIVGDFNYHVEDTSDSEACSFTNLIESLGFIQHVADSTHRSGHTLDIVLSRSHDSLVLQTRSIDHGFPDHFPVFTYLSLRKPPLPTREVKYRKLKTITNEVLLEAIGNSAICMASLSTLSLDELTTLYDTELRKLIDALAPTKTRTITIRPESEWYNESIREAKQTRRQAERLWRKTVLVVHREMYVEKRDMVNVLIDREKTHHYQSIIAENQGNTKQLFSVVHLLLGKSKTTPLPSNKSASELCSLFGDFFVEKISKIRNSIPAESNSDNPEVPESSSTMAFFKSVTVVEVTKLVTSMTNKSCELDPMPTSFVKVAVGALAPIITRIVNGSLMSGVFPSCYKEALVTPLLKKQSLDCNLLQNYRPVSNLTLISKTIEKVVSAQLNTYLKDNNLLEPCQSAYRQGHSTETALVRVQNDVICAVGQRKAVLLVLLDMSAAFDTVNHQLLIKTLQQLGIRGTMLHWFSTYLIGRLQRIKVNGVTSQPKILDCGVPQGSVLGPILFTIYTASLGQLLRQLDVQYHFYADDSQLWVIFKPPELDTAIGQMEKCIVSVQKWMLSHQLKMNDDKTEFLVISSKSIARGIGSPSLHIGDHQVDATSSARNIGVTMDSKASMDAHVLSVCKSSFIHIRNLIRIKKFVDSSSLECLVHAFITTKLDYCNSLLCGAPSTLINKLQRIQNIVARIITGHGRCEHITPVLKALHWLPVQQRIKFKTLVLVYKAVNNLAPVYLQELLHPHVPCRGLRSSEMNLLVVPFTRSSVIQQCAFSAAGPRLWNSLPLSLRSAPRLSVFKSQLKTYLFEEYYG